MKTLKIWLLQLHCPHSDIAPAQFYFRITLFLWDRILEYLMGVVGSKDSRKDTFVCTHTMYRHLCTYLFVLIQINNNNN